ncbi:MAG: folate family ECF transporter S component [Pelosinus sp.]|nr:folate family ECF transporter S component [Pelosinus sp.]
MKFTTRDIVYLGLFIAINIILTRVTSIKLSFGGVEYIRIGFGALPLLFCSIFLGPRQGMIAGILGDLIGYQINPSGIYLPQFTMIAGFTGFLPGLLFRLFKCKMVFSQLLLVIAITQLITTVLLAPYVLWQIFGIPLIINIPPRLVSLAATAPLFAYLILTMQKRLFFRTNLQH